MSNITSGPSAAVIEQVLLGGDLSKLSSEQKVSYYNNVCNSLGLNPLTKPFDYIRLNGKEVLYAKRDATEQLRKIHAISLTIKAREKSEDLYIVTANAKNKEGREDESVGAVNIQGLKGDILANAIMKAETKAKRRVTLSICGLGMLDELEVETIESAETEKPKDEKQALKQALNQKQKAQVEKLVQPMEVPFDYGSFVPKMGNLKGRPLKERDIYEVVRSLEWVKQNIKVPNQGYKDFIHHASEFIKSREPDYESQ